MAFRRWSAWQTCCPTSRRMQVGPSRGPRPGVLATAPGSRRSRGRRLDPRPIGWLPGPTKVPRRLSPHRVPAEPRWPRPHPGRALRGRAGCPSVRPLSSDWGQRQRCRRAESRARVTMPATSGPPWAKGRATLVSPSGTGMTMRSRRSSPREWAATPVDSASP